MRHFKFPQVVKSLYDNSCAVCSLNVHATSGGSVIDAAHIIPFAETHNDSPRNGLALCKNHHWGFDAGWFGFSDDYKLIVSEKMQRPDGYVRVGDGLRLPMDAAYAPAVEALRWHRKYKVETA